IFRPPTRFMKNSSIFEPVMARNLTRSSSGLYSASASLKTRRLNSSQVSSRFRYSDGSSSSAPPGSPDRDGLAATAYSGAAARRVPFREATSVIDQLLARPRKRDKSIRSDALH